MSPTPTATTPPIPAAEVHSLLRAELSQPRRMAYVLLLLLAVLGAGLLTALWITEPALPPRTHLAFGVLLVVALSWAAFLLWTLARRQVLFLHHRILAGRLALAATATFTVGCLVLAATVPGQRPLGLLAAAFGAGLFGLAGVVWHRARSRRNTLLLRRDELEQTLV